MGGKDMRYDELYDAFIDLFPEDKELFERLEAEANVNKNEDGMHVMFGMVVTPYIRKIVTESPIKAKKAFDFLEEMELNEDPEVGNVVEVSVLEALMTDEGGIKKYLEYIGPKSLEAARYMSQFYSVEPF